MTYDGRMTTPAAPLRAVVYVRLSVYRGETDPTTSPARQREVSEAYCRAKGWEVLEVVEDLDVSGSDKGMRLDRPGLRRVRELLPSVGIVIFAKLDRLARSVVDFRAFAEEAERHGVALVSVAESLDLTTPGGRFVSTILAAFAEMEASTIAERTRAGKRAATQLRRWTGGGAPYGYEVVPHPSGKGKALAVNADEAEHIRAAVDVVLGGGSLYSAMRLLHERGSTPRKAAAWALSSVKVVLIGAAIRGHVSHLGDVLRDAEGLPEVVHAPIITEAEGLALDDLLAVKRPHLTRRKAFRLLSGVLRCSSCGGRLTVGSIKGKPRYSCKGRSDGAACERATSVMAEPVETFVSEAFLDAVGWMPVTELRLLDNGATEVASVEKAIAETTDQLREPDADVVALVERLTTLRARRTELAAAGPRLDYEVVATGETFAEAWTARDEAGRRDLLLSALDAVTIYPGVRGRRGFDASRVELEWRS